MKKFLLLFVFLSFFTGIMAENRTALVIGNGDYQNFSKLGNPVTEAKLFSQSLKRLGFDVILITDVSKEEMLDAVYSFEERVRENGGIALFHYGGHAVQVDGKNYLIPVDAEIQDQLKVRTRAVDAEEVLASMVASGSDTNIVILDSCRNNPLPGASRDGTRGLAVVGSKPKNSIIVYSAESGTVAMDGVFTPVLMEYIEKPGVSFSEIMRMTRTAVNQRTGGEQTPGEYNQLFEQIYLNGKPESMRNETVVKSTINGQLLITVETECRLFVDGAFSGIMKPGAEVNFISVSVGKHHLEVKFSNGKNIAKNVSVEKDELQRVYFNASYEELLKKRELVQKEYEKQMSKSKSLSAGGWSLFSLSVVSMVVGGSFLGLVEGVEQEYKQAAIDYNSEEDISNLYNKISTYENTGYSTLSIGAAGLITSIGLIANNKSSIEAKYDKMLYDIEMEIASFEDGGQNEE